MLATERENAIVPAQIRLIAASCVVALHLLTGTAAFAEEAASTTGTAPQNGLSFTVTPYLWIAGISGTVSTPFSRVPERSVEANFGDTLSNLSGFAFMGSAEMRYGRFGLLADVLTLTVESDVSTPRDRLFLGGKGRFSTTSGTVLGTWRAWEDGSNALDLGAGFRPWSVNTRLSLNEGLLAARTLKPSASWIDPVLALRYTRRLGTSWSASVYGDVGGFGAGSDLTWQLLGTINYQVSDSISLRAGYRHMQLEHRKQGTDVDVGLSGPLVAVSFRF
ncbi:hypothetical protein M0638_23835 [Roseomonas sp. NAR14]|uniref:Outer membrane protein beta-barrel domain-containing protein n=1 Tax=Roseomonas acroporae TaxID=2937791 RepID=A0A9X1YCU7_9PROT|nr:hypothetical protein [Roseomonas acroporae]MCK8787405.1 hypothetical protein [Roseomonas acroporae]